MTMAENIPRTRADRRQLQQIIAGLTEGVVLVDPDGTIVWANEAAIGMHGVKSLQELGNDAREYRARFDLRYRNNHSLEPGQYPLERLLAGEIFSDVVVEVSRRGGEHPGRVLQVGSLILTKPSDEPDCLVLVLHDATERFEAEERFERTFSANPAPAIICRLSDMRFVKVNQGFLEMSSYARAELIGRSVYEIDILDRAERREIAIEALNHRRTIPQMEASLRTADGSRKLVIVAGQPIEIGEAACMLFTFIDLEPRRRVEVALRASEERFAKSFRLSPVPTLLHGIADQRIVDVNDAFLKVTGYAAEEVVGRTITEIGLWRSGNERRAYLRGVEQQGAVRSLDMQLQTKDGSVLACAVSAEGIDIEGAASALCVLQDVTERRRTEEELVAAIEAVMQDASWFSRTVIEKLAALRGPSRGKTVSAALSDLTARERQVLALLCEGLADKEIAERLKLSNSTVRNCVSGLYRKIGVKRRSAAVVWARERAFTGTPAMPDQDERT